MGYVRLRRMSTTWPAGWGTWLPLLGIWIEAVGVYDVTLGHATRTIVACQYFAYVPTPQASSMPAKTPHTIKWDIGDVAQCHGKRLHTGWQSEGGALKPRMTKPMGTCVPLVSAAGIALHA